MRTRFPRSNRAEVTVPAPVEAVWRVVADPTRTGEWSHECRSVELIAGATSIALGTRFRGANKAMWWRWSRVNEVIELESGRAIGWRTLKSWRFYDSTEWRIELEPVASSGTRIVQTYDIVYSARWWEFLMALLVPPHLDRSDALAADLARLGEVAAAEVRGNTPADPGPEF